MENTGAVKAIQELELMAGVNRAELSGLEQVRVSCSTYEATQAVQQCVRFRWSDVLKFNAEYHVTKANSTILYFNIH